jgi:hypothetical protein
MDIIRSSLGEILPNSRWSRSRHQTSVSLTLDNRLPSSYHANFRELRVELDPSFDHVCRTSLLGMDPGHQAGRVTMEMRP